MKKNSNSNVPPIEIVLRPKIDNAETQERQADRNSKQPRQAFKLQPC